MKRAALFAALLAASSCAQSDPPSKGNNSFTNNNGSTTQNNGTVGNNGTSGTNNGTAGTNNGTAGTNNETTGSNNMTTVACGNGVLDSGELCDPGIASGDGACPTDCASATTDVCSSAILVGDAKDCTAECVVSNIEMCIDADGCCPAACNANTDNDCQPVCGNGVIEGAEVCDGDCPASCDDGMACTEDVLTGSGSSCTATCTNTPIAACTGGDGCCPSGCNETNDSDCSPMCGNGVVETNEVCDGDCPASCNDNNACTADSMIGSPSTCNVSCNYAQINVCVGGDGCCPSACNATTDSDCSPVCGNGVIEGNEVCEGNCPTSCPPSDACTTYTLAGNPASCTSQCQMSTTTACINNDGCCPSSCNATNDTDCAAPVGGACTDAVDCQSGGCLNEPLIGGYCTNLCQTDTDCAAGAHCGFIDGEGLGVCVDNCSADADCRQPDYICYDADEAGTDECWAVGSGTGAPGDACTVHADCAGGVDGWCVTEDRGWQNGYCLQQCTAVSGCPTGSHCSAIDTNTGFGVCMDDCSVDTDCRAEGYLCYDFDENAVDECAPASTGIGQVGEPCNEAFDCAGGVDGGCLTQEQGWHDGYCTEVCNAQNPCPTGSHCGALDTNGDGVCLQDCAGDGECRLDGFQCFDVDSDAVDECWPSSTGTSPVGGPCEGYQDCVGGRYGNCITGANWPDGYCTIHCAAGEGTCTPNSACETSVDLCFETCATDNDCRAPYLCDATTTPANLCI